MAPVRLLRRGLAGVAALQVLAVCVPLLAVGTELVQAARFGFEPSLERYGGYTVSASQAGLVDLLVERMELRASPLAAPVAAVWGLGAPEGRTPTLEDPGFAFLDALIASKMRVRLHAVGDEAFAARLPDEVTLCATPAETLDGADFLVLLSHEALHRSQEPEAVAGALGATKVVFDGLATWSHHTEALDDHGVFYVPLWNSNLPFFLDPRMLAFAERMREESDEDDTFLLLPGHFRPELKSRFRPNSDLASTRYFLPVGYQLLPREVLVVDPVDQSGTLPQYQAWFDRNRSTEWPQFTLRRFLQEAGPDWVLNYRITPYWLEAEWLLQDLRRDDPDDQGSRE